MHLKAAIAVVILTILLFSSKLLESWRAPSSVDTLVLENGQQQLYQLISDAQAGSSSFGMTESDLASLVLDPRPIRDIYLSPGVVESTEAKDLVEIMAVREEPTQHYALLVRIKDKIQGQESLLIRLVAHGQMTTTESIGAANQAKLLGRLRARWARRLNVSESIFYTISVPWLSMRFLAASVDGRLAIVATASHPGSWTAGAQIDPERLWRVLKATQNTRTPLQNFSNEHIPSQWPAI